MMEISVRLTMYLMKTVIVQERLKIQIMMEFVMQKISVMEEMILWIVMEMVRPIFVMIV